MIPGNYLNHMKIKDYYSEKQERPALEERPGPVITLARDYGCRANEIAQALVEKIQASHTIRRKHHSWRIVNREFFEEVAENLHMHPHKIEHVLQPHEKSLLEEFVTSYSSEHIDDLKIRKALRKVVASYAEKGNIIIVGRAGVAITRSVPNSLHIRLEAPLDWRVEHLMKSRSIKKEEARSLASKTDEARQLFISQMRKEPFEEAVFDAIYNRATLSSEAIVESIFQLVVSSKIL